MTQDTPLPPKPVKLGETSNQVPPSSAPQQETPPMAPPLGEPFPPSNEPNIINTANHKSDGLDKCPKCGSTEISYSMTQQALVCSFCRHSWNESNAEEKFGLNTDIGSLRGTVVASGADKIETDDTTVTIKCQGCGAEVVIQTQVQLETRCHWCRQVLSVNTQVPNGAVPDALLPFKVSHAEAVEEIRKFVGKRRLFAWSKFKKEFVPENVVGVYMPYMVIDGNLTGELVGEGEIKVREYTVSVGSGDDRRSETRYDADVYQVARKFDFHVDDLITESNSARADFSGAENTNNVINAILPFDTKNAVAYSSKYLSGFTSEKRDLDVSSLDDTVKDQFLSIARAQATKLSPQYDRGIRWESEGIDIHGTRWVAIYVPVWLYSYFVPKGNGRGFVHYIAVNGRNSNVMGSVPVSHPKLWLASIAGFLATGIPIYGSFLSF